MGDVTTGGSSTKPNSKLVGQTSDMLLKGLQDAYKGGVDVYGKPLYTDPSAATKSAWGQGTSFGNSLIGSGGYGTGQRAAQDSLGGLSSNFGKAAATNATQLGGIFGGYGKLGDNNGLTGGQSSAMSGTAGLGSKYGALGAAYDPNSAAFKTMRQGALDDAVTGVGSAFTASGRFGGGSYIDDATTKAVEAIAPLDYANMQNDINNRYRSLDSQRGVFGDVFGMGQQGVGNQFGALSGQAGTANSIFGNRTSALNGMAGLAGQQFGMGQTALGNKQGAIGLLGQIGASQDADSLARRMADADLFDKTQNRDWNTLGRATSILGGNQTASGSTTSNSVPWWAALLGGAATGASLLG
jgi:hypothetical protein